MERRIPDAAELMGLGLYDPDSPDASDHLELVRCVLDLGASIDEVTASDNLKELALDIILRPRGRSTLSAVVATTEIDWPRALDLMAAAGLATDPDEILTDDEATAVRLLAATSANVLGEAATTQIARVTGNAMARVAETLVGAFRLMIELPHRDAGTRSVEVVSQYAELTETLLPAFVSTLDAVLRRQIVAVTEGMWSTDEERSAVTVLRTVGFVDLVGYTSTTTSLTVRELTNVLVEFDKRTAEVVAKGNGHIVKMIGDEAMFVTEDATDACRIALELVDAADGELPPVRVGLAAGEMVSVFGDLYGENVNLAARLVAVADPATAVVSDQVRAAVNEFEFEPLPPLELKGFSEPIVGFLLR